MHMVIRTATDATAADVEQWAAQQGCIVANIIPVPDGALLQTGGEIITPDDGERIWTAEIVIRETIE